MPPYLTYRQNMKWIEDSWGAVSCRIVISDMYEGLFADDSHSQEIDILNISDISKSVKDVSGGIEKRELNVSIKADRTLIGTNLVALEFIKQAEDATIRRYIAVFIDTTNPPVPEDMLYNGLINSLIESEDKIWMSVHYDSNITPIRDYKLKSTPIDDSIFGKFSLADLINGNVEKNCPGIDSTWESDNVKNRQGYFQDGVRKVLVYQLVNLNVLIRKLADNLETAITGNGYGNIKINFTKSQIDGHFIPTRWKQKVVGSNRYRYIASTFPPTPQYVLYDNDYNIIYIDPDNKPAEYLETALGVPANIPSKQYASESIWVSYGFAKPLEHEAYKDSAKPFMITKYKSFIEFLNVLALNFGVFLKVSWTSSIDMKIEFIGRSTTNSKLITLKSATRAQVKPSTSNIEDKTFVGKANYLSLEGSDYYIKDNLQGLNYLSSNEYDLSQGESILLTISPTLCYITDASDGGNSIRNVYLPHNHFHYDDKDWLENNWAEAAGFHSAIYLFTNKNLAHVDANFEAESYFTPAGAITITINNKDLQYFKLSDYINKIAGLDNHYRMYEYNIEFPWLYSAKYNNIINWKNLDLFNRFTLDGVEWVIVECKWNISTKTYSIVAHSSERFTYSNNIVVISQQSQFADTINFYKSSVVGDNIGTASEDINVLDVVSRKFDGTYEKAKSTNTHYGRVVGIATKQAITGEYLVVQSKGEIDVASQITGDINSPVFLRTNDVGTNLSLTPLITKSINEDLYCIIGKLKDTGKIELYSNIKEYILE